METIHQHQNNRALGTEKERLAEAFLSEQGIVILDRNFRCRTGEIDLIGIENGDRPTLIFFEVKFRRSSRSGTAAEAVTPRKQMIIRRVAEFYLYQRRNRIPPDRRMRFDVIAIDGDNIHWIRDAF